MRWRALEVEVSATLGGIQKPCVLGELVGRGKAVYGPGLSARPTRIIAPALVGRLPQKFAGFGVKETFVRRAAVAPHQKPAGGEAVIGGDLQ